MNDRIQRLEAALALCVDLIEMEGIEAPGGARELLSVASNPQGELMSAVEEILNEGHMNQEHLARLRAAWEAVGASPRGWDAENARRYLWLRGWLVRHGLLRLQFCRPGPNEVTSNWWVLHEPRMVSVDSCEGYAKTSDGAIDCAAAR